MNEEKGNMPYGVVGDDGLTAEERLAKYSGVVDWSYLKAACLNEVLYYVDKSLAIREVAMAFMKDESPRIDAWLKSGDLVKMGDLHLKYFDDRKSQRFDTAVVTPFVLCREIEK